MNAVEVEALSKRYRIGGNQELGYKTVRDAFSSLFRRKPSAEPARTFWALNDVSFEVKDGEAIGIIGKNGAGKSTLLKLLSRITEPTSGTARLRGRVASLLEVGTGFHPELTGRENIFLNGAILGMSRAEVRKNFDAIVDFSEVAAFLDTPVKRYSSGMYVRLAFAVAAHLDPEILIVDEVLAVGDVGFQRKCLEKMGKESGEGRTVLFVSHNMPAIRQLCSKGIWLKDGRVACCGTADQAVRSYLDEFSADGTPEEIRHFISSLAPDPTFRLRDFQLIQAGRRVVESRNGEPVEVVITYDIFDAIDGFHLVVYVSDTEGTLLFDSLDNGSVEGIPRVEAGRYESRLTIPANFLAPITYEISLMAGIHNIRRCMSSPLIQRLSVVQTGSVNRAYPGYLTPGRIAPLLEWRINREELT